jgi:hypothetical protein
MLALQMVQGACYWDYVFHIQILRHVLLLRQLKVQLDALGMIELVNVDKDNVEIILLIQRIVIVMNS